MNITILQRDIKWNNRAVNIARADEAIERMPGADLYVLPEMFSTGFCVEPNGIAESIEGESLQWMKRKAAAINAAIAGSVAVTDGERYYNRFYFVKPNGEVEYYDKHHLFTYGNEHIHFTQGDKRIIVEWRGVRILLEVCYDLRFPVWARNRGDYDMILYVASWPSTRAKAWSALLVARAIENQCYVAGVNRVGSDPKCEYSGNSVIVNPYGEIVAECEVGVECESSVNIDMALLRDFRDKFPVLNDADYFDVKDKI